MILNTLRIIYNDKELYILYLSDNFIQFKNGLYFPSNNETGKFFAFECLNEARKIISEISIEYDRELFECTDIDKVSQWVRSNETNKISLEELMVFNSYIYSFISFKYDGVSPQEFVKHGFKGMEKAIQVYIANELMEQCLSIKNPESKIKAYIKELKVFSDDEIKQILNSPELKKDVEILLNFFQNHIKIIKSKGKEGAK